MNHRRWDIEEMFPVKLINAIATNEDWIGQTSNAESTTVSAHTKTYENKNRRDRVSILKSNVEQKETNKN